MNLRIRPSIKAKAEGIARQDERSLAQTIERLIDAEATRRASKGEGVKQPALRCATPVMVVESFQQLTSRIRNS
jgi:hypothetical protein